MSLTATITATGVLIVTAADGQQITAQMPDRLQWTTTSGARHTGTHTGTWAELYRAAGGPPRRPWDVTEDYHRAYPGRLTDAEYRRGGVIVARWDDRRVWTEAVPDTLDHGAGMTVTHHGPDGKETHTVTADEWPLFLASIGDRIGRDTPS